MKLTTILLTIIVVLTIVLIKVNNIDSIPLLRKDKSETQVQNKPESKPQTYQLPRRIYLTILDCNQDTITINEIYLPENNSYWNKFKTDSSYVISFSELIKHTDNGEFYAHDMAYMRVYQGILQKGNLAYVKKNFAHKKNYKYNFVANINWPKVSINEISADILDWDMSSIGFSDFVTEAVKNKWSYAKTAYIWQTEDSSNNIQYNLKMKNPADSVFKKSVKKDIYYLSLDENRKEEGECFGIHDLGIVADINNDGYADRIATWHDYDTGGVCGITKKSKNGLIEFFQYSQPTN